MHKNAMGQPCDGVLCEKCTRCSNCKYQKPGSYKAHHHVFAGVKQEVLTRATTKS
jgi:hypothetical protein